MFSRKRKSPYSNQDRSIQNRSGLKPKLDELPPPSFMSNPEVPYFQSHQVETCFQTTIDEHRLAMNNPIESNGKMLKQAAVELLNKLQSALTRGKRTYDYVENLMVEFVQPLNHQLPDEIVTENLNTPDDFFISVNRSETASEIATDIDRIVTEMDIVSEKPEIGAAVYNSIVLELTEQHPELKASSIHTNRVTREIMLSARRNLSTIKVDKPIPETSTILSSTQSICTTYPPLSIEVEMTTLLNPSGLKINQLDYGPKPDPIALKNAIELVLTTDAYKQQILMWTLSKHPIFQRIPIDKILQAIYFWLLPMTGIERIRFIMSSFNHVCPTCKTEVLVTMDIAVHPYCRTLQFLLLYEDYVLLKESIFAKKKPTTNSPWSIFVNSLTKTSPVRRFLDESNKLVLHGLSSSSFIGEAEAMRARRISESSESSSSRIY